jgi:hypothetical protein
VKLGKNATLVQCSLRLMGEKLQNSQVLLSGINISKRVARTWKNPRSHRTDENVEKVRNVV